jgi:hypothetical protein
MNLSPLLQRGVLSRVCVCVCGYNTCLTHVTVDLGSLVVAYTLKRYSVDLGGVTQIHEFTRYHDTLGGETGQVAAVSHAVNPRVTVVLHTGTRTARTLSVASAT